MTLQHTPNQHRRLGESLLCFGVTATGLTLIAIGLQWAFQALL